MKTRTWRDFAGCVPGNRGARRPGLRRAIRSLGPLYGLVEVPVGIHPLVEYTHHIDHVVAANPVVQRVRSDSVLAVARADVIAGPSDRRIGHDAFDRTLDLTQVLLGLIVIPPLRAVIPDTVLGRRVRLVKARTGSPVARFLGSLTSNELVEVERRRVTTLFASNEGLSQRPQADLTILKQPQGRPHNVAGRAVTARCNLILDERAEMLIKAERRIPTHIHEGTNSWYRRLAPRLLMMFRRVLRSPTPPRRRKQQQTPPPDRQRWRRAAQQQRRQQEEQPPLSAVEMHERLTTVDTNTPAMKNRTVGLTIIDTPQAAPW